jgi:uncharacterized short protein YbdD (DUF466 family)
MLTQKLDQVVVRMLVSFSDYDRFIESLMKLSDGQ